MNRTPAQKWQEARALLPQIAASRRSMREGLTQLCRDEGAVRYTRLTDQFVEVMLALEEHPITSDFSDLAEFVYGGDA